jgi:penicillin G amidase
MPRLRRLFRLRHLALLTALVLAVAAGAGVWVWRRALPQVRGTLHAPGLAAPVEIERDRWGVPHIFARSDADAYYALGWVMVQDRLFQMDVLRHVAQGRLAELFGPSVLEVDRLFRTVDVPGVGRRMYAGTRPEVRAALAAFTAGANASLAALGRSLPPEYTVLRTTPAPFRPDDFAGAAGFMAWQLNPAWHLDPLYERIVAKVGPQRAAGLFPQAELEPSAGAAAGRPGARPSAWPSARPSASPSAWRGAPPRPDALRLTAAQQALLATLPSWRASNSFAVAPGRSATGHALLANDPHLGLSLPGTWYEAQLSTPRQDVIGVFLPGVPFAVIGHNRDIAWGLVNANLDAGDFFVEHLDARHPGEVLYKARWVPLAERRETIHIKGEAPVELLVRSTPHGPLVDGLLPGQGQALSYRWVYAAAEDANEINGFYDLDRARDWAGFRAAVSQFGAVAQTATYADRKGHIGEQTTGRIPLRAGRRDGLRYRAGWSGAEEWEGFLPFARNPSVLDPPGGVVAVANNPPAQPPAVYLSAYYEPEDRIRRIRALLARKPRLSADDLERIQGDVVLDAGRTLAPQILAAFAAEPPHTAAVRDALEALRGWDGAMTMDSRAATVFAAFYKHLFRRIFADELGDDLLAALREHTNQSAVMIEAVLSGGQEAWLDDVKTPAREDRAAIFRAALGDAAAELVRRLGQDPAGWQWGKLHQITFRHPLGRVALLAPLFNEGPYPLPGHDLTIDKAQFDAATWQVYLGPSMRQVTDLGDPAHAWAVLPLGESGLPASPHYADQFPLWRGGRYHPLLMERDDLDKVAEGRLVLEP